MKKSLSLILFLILFLSMATCAYAETKIPMDECSVSFKKSSYKYTGNGITPEPIVTYKNKKLIKDKDYNIVYKDNVNVGTATVTLIGLGEYTGTTTGSFSIVKSKQTIEADNIKATYGDAPVNINAVAKNPLSYKSSDENVAEVSQVGTVTFRNAGKCKIIITAEGNMNVDKATKTINVSVGKAEASVKAYGGRVRQGETLDLKASTTSDGKLSYKSSNKKTATVSKDGVVRARKSGTCIITVKAAATRNYKAASTEVAIEVY